MGLVPLDENAVSILDDVKKEMEQQGIKGDYSEAVRFLRQKAETNVR